MPQPGESDLEDNVGENIEGREDIDYDDLEFGRFTYKGLEVISRQWNDATHEWAIAYKEGDDERQEFVSCDG